MLYQATTGKESGVLMSALDYYLDTWDDGETPTHSGHIPTGVVRFPPVSFTRPGEYHFTVRELTASHSGWTTDLHSFPVTVTVTADELGHLVADISYPKGEPRFINTYKNKPAKPARICLQGKKVVCGTCLSKDTFAFSIFDAVGRAVAHAHNDKNGNISFPALTFGRPGVFSYTMQEDPHPSKNWITDKRQYPIVITVLAGAENKLIAIATYPDGLPVFVNQYAPRCHTTCVPGSGETIYLPRCNPRSPAKESKPLCNRSE